MKVNKFKPKYIVWLLPAFYTIHLVEEAFVCSGLYVWISEIFNVDFSLNDFIFINAVGFIFFISFTFLYTFDKANNFIFAAMGSLIFTNGIVHTTASLVTLTYSPGTISGVIFYIPLGAIIFNKILPLLPEHQRSLSIATGIILHIAVSVIAFNI
jgi:hypothetical protein